MKSQCHRMFLAADLSGLQTSFHAFFALNLKRRLATDTSQVLWARLDVTAEFPARIASPNPLPTYVPCVFLAFGPAPLASCRPPDRASLSLRRVSACLLARYRSAKVMRISSAISSIPNPSRTLGLRLSRPLRCGNRCLSPLSLDSVPHRT